MNIKKLQQLIAERLTATGMSARQASLMAVGRPDFVRDIKNGSMPSFDKVIKLLEVLGVEFELLQEAKSGGKAITFAARPVKPAQPEFLPGAVAENLNQVAEYSEKPDATAERIEALENGLRDVRETLRRIEARQYKPYDDDEFSCEELSSDLIVGQIASSNQVTEAELPYGSAAPVPAPEPALAQRFIPTMELAAAAGGGATELDETIVGYLGFQRIWLDRHAIDPTCSVVIGVRGESMDPTLPNGCSILVDRSRTTPMNGRIYLLRTSDGLVVKRLKRQADNWEINSDNPKWPPQPWNDETAVLGQAVWTARVL